MSEPDYTVLLNKAATDEDLLGAIGLPSRTTPTALQIQNCVHQVAQQMMIDWPNNKTRDTILQRLEEMYAKARNVGTSEIDLSPSTSRPIFSPASTAQTPPPKVSNPSPAHEKAVEPALIRDSNSRRPINEEIAELLGSDLTPDDVRRLLQFIEINSRDRAVSMLTAFTGLGKWQATHAVLQLTKLMIAFGLVPKNHNDPLQKWWKDLLSWALQGMGVGLMFYLSWFTPLAWPQILKWTSFRFEYLIEWGAGGAILASLAWIPTFFVIKILPLICAKRWPSNLWWVARMEDYEIAKILYEKDGITLIAAIRKIKAQRESK